MSDPEIEELRDKVHCAVVLEHTPPLWKLDRKESTKLSLKYRRGKGEILIVSHGGRGWWDPTSDAKGRACSRLVQRLEPGAKATSPREFAAQAEPMKLRSLTDLPPHAGPIGRPYGPPPAFSIGDRRGCFAAGVLRGRQRPVRSFVNGEVAPIDLTAFSRCLRQSSSVIAYALFSRPRLTSVAAIENSDLSFYAAGA